MRGRKPRPTQKNPNPNCSWVFSAPATIASSFFVPAAGWGQRRIHERHTRGPLCLQMPNYRCHLLYVRHIHLWGCNSRCPLFGITLSQALCQGPSSAVSWGPGTACKGGTCEAREQRQGVVQARRLAASQVDFHGARALWNLPGPKVRFPGTQPHQLVRPPGSRLHLPGLRWDGRT